ncbi:hypothetical protein Taro_015064 [Colocasia esculenta]|uniref:Uncharacterized protein n=1 Tax=Colocasia esculenta TaxID=4460 RepID=A0A843UGD9_COLES|nr:hypothetical protein [Colocasia esculenta]
MSGLAFEVAHDSDRSGKAKCTCPQKTRAPVRGNPRRVKEGCTPVGPGRVHPRRVRRGAPPPVRAGAHPCRFERGALPSVRAGAHPRRLAQGGAPPLAWQAFARLEPTSGCLGMRVKLSRGDLRLRDFSSPTLARRSRVPAKLEAVWRSRILSRRSSGEVPLLWEGGDLFVLRMKTPVQDSVCVKLHKGPPGEEKIRPCGAENGKDSLTVRASCPIWWSGTHVASMKWRALSWV